MCTYMLGGKMFVTGMYVDGCVITKMWALMFLFLKSSFLIQQNLFGLSSGNTANWLTHKLFGIQNCFQTLEV